MWDNEIIAMLQQSYKIAQASLKTGVSCHELVGINIYMYICKKYSPLLQGEVF
ncbi:hypothetical protein CAL7102_07749 [Dulcicalothrix desertica PCC 7102]|nr:hypothetical protein CAL7102_07749 [Dulcicalothrix desertica PCC 7102]